jgi:NAD(P)-dependent dehydrogenase (short-subunit alcohol dehydrogenase family)
VTGGGRGIGRAIALASAEAGAQVVVADYGGAVNRNQAGSSEAADSVVAEIKETGGEAVAAAVDISTMQGGRDIVDAAVDSFGRLDGMVCAAGITALKYLWDLEEQEWDDVINVHLKGHFSCAKAAARVMVPQRSGSLIFMSSGALNGMPNTIAYSTAKAGILGLTRTMAKEWGRYNVNVNAVGFGLIQTRLVQPASTDDATVNMHGNQIRVGVPPDALDALTKSIPLGRLGTPEEAADAVLFFCSPLSDYVTGEVLICGGGLHF